MYFLWVALLHIRVNCYHPPFWQHFVSMDVTFFETQPYFSSVRTPLHGENLSEEEFFTPLPVSAPVLDQDKQQLLANSLLLVLLLSRMCYLWKNWEFTLDAIQTSNPNSGSTASIPYLNPSIPIVNDMNHPIALTIPYLILFHISTFHHHIVLLCLNCCLCLFQKIYKRHLVIQSGGKPCKKWWKPFTKIIHRILLNFLMGKEGNWMQVVIYCQA